MNSDAWDSGTIWRVFFQAPGSIGVAYSIHQQFGTTLDLFSVEDPPQLRKGYAHPATGLFVDILNPHPFAALYETNAARRARLDSGTRGADDPSEP